MSDLLADTGEVSPAATNGSGGGILGDDRIYCDHCDWSKPRPPLAKHLANGWLQNHIKSKHPEHFEKRGAARPTNKEKSPAAPKTSRPKSQQPTPNARRVSAAEVIEGVAGIVGSALVHTEIDPGVGTLVSLAAPVIGEDLDEIAKGTVLDRVALQPLARSGGRSRRLIAVAGVGVAVAACERARDAEQFKVRFERFHPIMYAGMGELVGPMLKAAKRAVEQRQKLMADFAELRKVQEELAALSQPGPDGEIADPIEAMIQGMFAHMFTGTAPDEG